MPTFGVWQVAEAQRLNLKLNINRLFAIHGVNYWHGNLEQNFK